MPTVLGVDGCPRGWCAVQLDTDTRALTSSHHDTFRNVLSTFPRITIAIDVPIGLMEGPGGRQCDREARKYLGRPRASSVFPPPVRQILRLTGIKGKYGEACHESRSATGGKAISQQSFWIGPKIREVDDVMTRALERRIYEAHPEVSFATINERRRIVGAQRAAPLRSMRYNKKTPKGRQERWESLRHEFPQMPPDSALPEELRRRCDLVDYIDALACAWTAARIAAGVADSMPQDTPRDGRGLRIVIWR